MRREPQLPDLADVLHLHRLGQLPVTRRVRVRHRELPGFGHLSRRLLARAAHGAALAVLAAAAVSAAAPGGDPAPVWTPLWERAVPAPARSWSRLLLADLDGDGGQDVLVVQERQDGPSRVVALDGRSGRPLWERSWPGGVAVAAGDVEGAAGAEVVAACGDSLAVLAGEDGRVLRRRRLEAPVGEVALARLDGDRAADVVYTAGTKHNDILAAVSGASWGVLWTRTTKPDGGAFGAGFDMLTVLDLDGDGLDEVLVTERRNTLTCLGPAGAVRWSAVLGRKTRFLPEGVASSRPAPVDLGGGAPSDVAIGCFAGGLVVLDGETGEGLVRMQFGLEAHEAHARDARLPRLVREALLSSGEPVLELQPVEIDGRPGDELVFGSSDGFLYAASPRRSATLWRFDTEGEVYDRCVPVPGAPTLLLAWDAKATYVLRAVDGAQVGRLPCEGGASAVAAGDLDADGVLDVVALPRPGGRALAWSIGVPDAGR
jgi:outer membrane protein assembly factor BamB